MGASQSLGEGGVGMGSQPFSVLRFQHLLCSFDAVTRRPPAGSPEDTFSSSARTKWLDTFCQDTAMGQIPRALALQNLHQKSPSKVCLSVPNWDSQR